MIKYLERRLTDLQQYVNREIEMILDDIKRMEWREEVHKSQVSNFKLTQVSDDPWRDPPRF
ncbi:hypothetical protein PVOR_11870 [Paenibacillus vortex V453]|uniref:Uncharacterized protein n=2 Tax=Paenibacillus TaxID=44249 RepID=A0A163L4D3_9BACL|nr:MULTISPECIES: hypothetical protein [Paenibacillus]AWP28759.1 hypothetical protein B9D94_19950 [Paenibacillus sp. Cedars]EFU41638.1 hypothetical protein PVOR_11870 [Paenibacillus vortex V453]KZS47802.1 hypothetical protein AWU65_18705 [Paenibacillus glucanolyticus]